ncbi:MAG: hypothetical protein ACT4QC_01735 [Planctomycetaceae bacterium]
MPQPPRGESAMPVATFGSLGNRALVVLWAIVWPLIVGCGSSGDSMSENQLRKLSAELDSFRQTLNLTIEENPVAVPLAALEIDLANNEGGQDTFEMHGPSAVLVGAISPEIRLGLEGKWQLLINKPIAFLPHASVHRREQSSRLMLLGHPTWPVLGGSFTVEQVGKGLNRQTPLNGTIEIRCDTPEGEKTYRGTFAVKGTTFG